MRQHLLEEQQFLSSTTCRPQEQLLLLQALIQMQTERFTVVAGVKIEQSCRSDLQWVVHTELLLQNWLSSQLSCCVQLWLHAVAFTVKLPGFFLKT